jgi:glutamate-1-semialdehyde 2,1-aminomutase
MVQALEPIARRFDRSAALARRTRSLLPGGVINFHYRLPPGPVYIDRADGAVLRDIDGNEFVDFWLSHSALLAGHNHPAVREAISQQLERGTNFGLGTPVQAEFVEALAGRMPSLECMTLTDSPSRSIAYAVRLARAATGRQAIAKAQGAYHGSTDTVYIGLQPPYGESPGARVVRPGVSERAAADMVLYQWNELEATEQILGARADELACIIVEPVVGDGVLAPDLTFLAALRRFCDEHGCVLVFDETITCGMGPGGAQEAYGLRPDLTVLGKSIGAGLPISALGGRPDLMALAAPGSPGLPEVPLGTTFPGHPLACAAGLAHMALLDTAAHESINRRTADLAAELDAIGRRHGAPFYSTSAGHLFFMHWREGAPVRTYREHFGCDGAALSHVSRRLFEAGIYIGWHGRGCTSLAHTDEQVARLLEVVDAAVGEVVAGAA